METPAPQTAQTEFDRERAALDALAAFVGDYAVSPVAGYTRDHKGHLVPDELIAEHTQIEDTTVRTIAAYALDLHRQIHRFIGHTYDDLAAMDDLMREKYGAKVRGGAKGNRTYTTHDGCIQVLVQVQDRIVFGPELAIARDLIDECIAEWSDGARAEIRALVQHAFEPDKQGEVSRESVFRLRRLEIDDARWRHAQAAITDAIRVIGSTSYVRFRARPTPQARRWTTITIDMTGAPLPETLSP